MTETAVTNKQTLGFEAEVKQLLHLMIHSLYSNKEIFLRELISNASDAADKLRFAALSDENLYEGDSELAIHIDIDKQQRTLIIRDNGIGMSREEIIEHLGTIAKSGTREFLQQLSKEQAKASTLIGQFGVGFYSAFMVADKVVVETRRAGLPKEQGVRWESKGEGTYTIEEIEKPERGTCITLHLNKEASEFLDEWRLRSIITRYSDHIAIPIKLAKQEVTEEEEKEEQSAKTANKQSEYETINRAKALWTLPKTEVKEEDYKEFYKHVAHDFTEPLAWSHNRVEGKQEYITLLYIPSKAPFDLYTPEQKRGLKLYVQRVFIMDDAQQFLPSYLRFVKGVVDSHDLPLNVSREMLQDNKLIETIRTANTKKILNLLEKMAKEEPEKYQIFWKEFGNVLKEGPAEDYSHREKIAKLLRFASTYQDSEEQTVSLDDYVQRMKPEQEKIYYITADSFAAAKNSPHLEIFRKKGIEVLLLSDRVDEWLVSHLTEYQGKQWQSVAKAELDLGNLEDEVKKEEKKKIEDEFAGLLKQMKEVLGERVKEVRTTQRLTESPACIVVDAYDMSTHMQRLLKAAGQQVPLHKPILEINPGHSIILRLKNEQDDARFAEWANVILDQAILAEGGQLDDPGTFIKRLNRLILTLAS